MFFTPRRQIFSYLPLKPHVSVNKLHNASGPSNSNGMKFWLKFLNVKFDVKPSSLNKLKSKLNDKLSLMGLIFTQQCNFYAAHRTRRLSQIWNLYSKLYRVKNVKNLVKNFRNSFIGSNRPAGFLLGAALFNWESNKITDVDLQHCINDFHHIDRLNTGDSNNDAKDSSEDNWELLLTKSHLKIWRKPLPNSYLYEYKVYGTFHDIPSHAFFSVQMDLDYRKKWDKHICKLDVIDSDDDSGCEIVHWVAYFPYPMYNREYVYIRTARVDHDNKVMVMSSKAIDHPKCPRNDRSNVRVEKYKSQMVIRPHKSFNENGFDYVLTYFDDPQAVFPSVAYNYIASSGVPEFVDTLHNAAKKLHQDNSNKPQHYTPNVSSIGSQSASQIPAYA